MDSKIKAELCQTLNGKALNSILAMIINYGEIFFFFK